MQHVTGGFTQSERYSEEDEIQPQGRMRSYTTTLTLEQWIEETQMWNLQSWDSPTLFNLLTEKIRVLADNPLPLTSENIAGRAKGQSAHRWTHQVTPRRARVWRVHRGSTLYNYLKENMAPLTDRPGEAADLIIGNRS